MVDAVLHWSISWGSIFLKLYLDPYQGSVSSIFPSNRLLITYTLDGGTYTLQYTMCTQTTHIGTNMLASTLACMKVLALPLTNCWKQSLLTLYQPLETVSVNSLPTIGNSLC